MKFFIPTVIITLMSLNLFAQDINTNESDKRSAITIGFLNGGGSLIGVDFEKLLSKRIGIQIGGGFKGYGGGINYHIKPVINSSFVSLQYWHQGLGNSYVQSILGPNFVFRSKKIFTCQLGIGYRVGEGPLMDEGQPANKLKETKVMFMYSIGIYIPH